MIFSTPLRIARAAEPSPGYFLLSAESPELAHEAQPGQFASLSCGADDPLIPRPISFMRATGDRVDFLVRVVGRATAMMAKMKEGEDILATGPLGKPLPELEDPVLVAGGIGVVPLAFYAARHGGRLLWGLKEPAPGLEAVPGSLVHETTYETGSGTVVDLVAGKYAHERSYIACGPVPMFRALLDLVPRERVILLAEGMMACGVGICLGCALPRAGGGFLRTCTEGPWFRAHDVDLGRFLG